MNINFSVLAGKQHDEIRSLGFCVVESLAKIVNIPVSTRQVQQKVTMEPLTIS
jgi:hypothetical protein